ncbi:MAG: HupE/UreJ family protein [Flavobacteriaceae bacterium]|nr:HupE/UreJ family protein [Flavobacteriaceae bacterium]
MELLEFYFKLGFNHVLDFNALDHILFFVLLALPFALKQWRNLLVLVTLFTIGHTVSLLFAYLGWINQFRGWIELLISLSIVLLAAKNIFTDRKEKITPFKKKFYWMVTLFFGLVHGLGFGGYYRQITPQGEVFSSLLGFALGIEVVQILVVGAVILLNYLIIQVFRVSEFFWVLLSSALILVAASQMLIRSILGLN